MQLGRSALLVNPMALFSRYQSPEPSVPTADTSMSRGLARLTSIRCHQWLYFPRLFSRGEKIAIGVLLLIGTASFVWLGARLFLRFTVPVPAVGGALREGSLEEPRFVNPIYATGDTDRDVTRLVFSSLIRHAADGSIVFDLAESAIPGDDGKTYTVVLRENVFWHDGEPFDADDVIFTIRAIQDPQYQSPLRQNWVGVGIEKIDARTVTFTLRQTYAPFIENLSVGIIPEHLWKRIPKESAPLSDLNLKPVGTGPYRFQKFNRREDGTISSLVLERNRNHHLEGPYLATIEFIFYRTERELLDAYRSGRIMSFVSLSRSPVGELRTLNAALHELRLPKVFAVFLNATAQPILGRTAVRKALALAIDRERIIAEALSSGGTPAHSAIPAATFGTNEDVPVLPFNPEEARRILAADGWKTNQDGILQRTEGRGSQAKMVPLKIHLVTSDAPELATAAKLVADMWNAIGVATELSILPISELDASVIRPRTYEALLFGEVFGRDPDPFVFWHTSQLKDPGLNIAMYSNRAVDELLEFARKTRDPAERAAKYRQFQKIIADEIGAIFLWNPIHYYAVHPELKAVAIGPITLPDERFDTVAQWHIDTRRTLK